MSIGVHGWSGIIAEVVLGAEIDVAAMLVAALGKALGVGVDVGIAKVSIGCKDAVTGVAWLVADDGTEDVATGVTFWQAAERTKVNNQIESRMRLVEG